MKNPNISKIELLKYEYKTVGLLPYKGDNQFYKKACIICSTKENVQLMQGVEVSEYVCQHCLNSF